MIRRLLAIRDLLPERVGSRLRGKRFRYSVRDIPPLPEPPSTPLRLYIAPANFAGQGYRWSRAAELIAGVGAVNLQVVQGVFAYTSDYSVMPNVFRQSRRWQQKHFEKIASGFTHVIIEASKSVFGPVFEGAVASEIQALRQRGVTVAIICHGSEIRLPSRHASEHPYSPFSIMPEQILRAYEALASSNRELLDGLDIPVFVSTPALLLDVPYAKWVPVVVDVDAWRCNRVALQRTKPVVVHAPSRAVMKRSDLVDSALEALDAEGLITYQRISGVPNSEMPQVLAGADIFVDAVGTGNYGVAACEAMASGCLVVSYITDQVQQTVRELTQFELPIVASQPNAVSKSIRDILKRRDVFSAMAQRGREFVVEVHNGERSAVVLQSFLVGPQDNLSQS